jgi:hypothetical protein
LTGDAGLLPILGLLAFLAGGFHSAQAQDGATLEDLSWLSGCWAGVGGEIGSVEQWMTPAGGTMLGMSRTVRDSQTVAYEYMQIRQSDDGRIEYTAMPSGQAAATFAMIGLSESEVIFENLEHDFPQRIIYRLKQDGRLEASIEGEVNGQARTVAFPMQSIPCRPPVT